MAGFLFLEKNQPVMEEVFSLERWVRVGDWLFEIVCLQK